MITHVCKIYAQAMAIIAAIMNFDDLFILVEDSD